MNIIIPARGGSRRIPGKNIKLFHGKPIIAYSIQLMRYYPGGRMIVSTDDPAIAEVAREYGAHPIMREAHLAEDNVGTQEVARHVLEGMDAADYNTLVLYATCPLLTPGNILHGISVFGLHGISVFGNSDRHYVHACDRYGADTGSFYYGRTSSFLAGIPLEGQSVTVEVDDIDINTPADWERAERLYEEKYL